MDLVKVFAIILSIVFFIFWVVGVNTTSNENELLKQQYDLLYSQCNSSISNSNVVINNSVEFLTNYCNQKLKNLHDMWGLSFNNLLNCYTSGTAKCNYILPTLNFSK